MSESVEKARDLRRNFYEPIDEAKEALYKIGLFIQKEALDQVDAERLYEYAKRELAAAILNATDCELKSFNSKPQ